ncbi:MAG TPA: ice-binding family protein [Acidimicrobiales bacterium]|nr:ice-binding family protein [Acidimicrobiales bacterium]
MASQAVTNTGSSVITGNVGLYPNTATSVTGFPPGTINGTEYAANGVANQAQTDAFGPAASGSAGAYESAASATPSNNVNYATLGGGTTLSPGVYNATSSMTVDGTLTLQGDPSSVFIFQAGSSLLVGRTNPTSVVLTAVSGASGPVQACHVFWQVTSSATLGNSAGNSTALVGTILALQSATLNLGASVDGRVLTGQASITLDDNTIRVDPCSTSIATSPSSSLITLGSGLDDVATVTGNATDGSPTGSLQFYECGPVSVSCSPSSGAALSVPATLHGGVATSPIFVPSAVGNYCFASAYTPDASSPYGSSSGVGDTTNGECFAVTAAPGAPPPVVPPPTITTSAASSGLITLGNSLDDVATVTGNVMDGTPTGMVQTYWCGPGIILCSSTSGTALAPAQALHNGVATSPGFTPGNTGTYCFASVYIPDAGSPYLASSESGTLTNGECFAAAASSAAPTNTVVIPQGDTMSIAGTASSGVAKTTVVHPGTGALDTGTTSDSVPTGSLALTGSDFTRLLGVAGALLTAGMLLMTLAHGYRKRSLELASLRPNASRRACGDAR